MNLRDMFKKLHFVSLPTTVRRRMGTGHGFTLLETIVAFGIILAAVVGPAALVMNGLSDFGASRNKLIAINLAQEGIELVRAIRENNVACDTLNGALVWPWNEDPRIPNPGNVFEDASVSLAADRTIPLNCGGVSGAALASPLPGDLCSENLAVDPSTGLYGYGGSPKTIFKRCLRIMVPVNPDADVPTSDQMDVIATVEWQEKGSRKSAVLRERLYNWR